MQHIQVTQALIDAFADLSCGMRLVAVNSLGEPFFTDETLLFNRMSGNLRGSCRKGIPTKHVAYGSCF